VLAITTAAETPLHYAARASTNAADVIKLLVDAGADPGAVNRNRETPVDVASDSKIKALLSEAEKQAAPQREAWRAFELAGRGFDVSAPGVTGTLWIRFRERGVYSAEGTVGGAYKRVEGTYYRGALTLSMNCPEGPIFPTLPGTTCSGRVIPGDDGAGFTLKIGATEVKFAPR